METEYQRYRRALDILTEGRLDLYPHAQRSSRLKRELEIFRARHLPWLLSGAIEALSVGEKIKKRRGTQRLAIKVYIRRKRSTDLVRFPVPQSIVVPRLGRFRTDVVGLGRFRLHAFEQQVRPVVPGISMSVAYGATGTIGCMVRSIGGGPILGLSCAHVVTNRFQKPPLGEPIEQPASDYQSQAISYRIGVSAGIVPVQFHANGAGYPNVVDAGLFTFDPGVGSDPTVRELGFRPLQTTTLPADTKATVRKVGTVTNLTRGNVIETGLKKQFEYDDPAVQGTKQWAGFRELFLANYSADEGDSGSLVVDDANRAVGLHIGSWDHKSLFCAIEPALEKLRVQLA